MEANLLMTRSAAKNKILRLRFTSATEPDSADKKRYLSGCELVTSRPVRCLLYQLNGRVQWYHTNTSMPCPILDFSVEIFRRTAY